MAENPLILVVYDDVGTAAQPDALDTLVQMRAVRAALASAGHRVNCVPFSADLAGFRQALVDQAPALVFNLVEAPLGSCRLALLLPALLEELRIPFTGADFATMLRLADKTLAQRWLSANGVGTPRSWCEGDPAEPAELTGPWMVKSVWEHASFGLSAANVVPTLAAAQALVRSNRVQHGGQWFAEQFVDGREFNVAILATPTGVAVLPLAEIDFAGLPDNAPRIVDYAAKWLPDSVEYQSTQRCFLDENREPELAARLREAALQTWQVCGLQGYARVDFRVDTADRPWVVDVNCNPCISPDAGFAAAAAEYGVDYAALIAALTDPLLEALALRKAG